MIEISKELLSKVIGISNLDYELSINKKELHYGNAESKISEFINIYELAHKCKQWALDNGYYLRAEQGINYYDNLQWVAYLNRDMDDGADYIEHWNNTEPEAIFKACEWILKQTKGEE